MAKRFTDTDKWKKGFLKALPSTYKIFWLYLCDDCTNAGIWETSEIDVACLRMGEKVDLQEALSLFNRDEQRIVEFDGGKKWFIPSFVTFQYGEDFAEKGSNNRLIGTVRGLLEKLGLLGLIPVRYPLERVAERVMEKDKDTDKEKEKKEGGPGETTAGTGKTGKDTKIPFGESGLVRLTEQEASKLAEKLGMERTAEYITRLENHIGSKGARYKSHYFTILSWASKDGDGPAKRPFLTKAQQHAVDGLRRLEAKYETRDVQKGGVIDLDRLPGPEVRA